MCADAGIECLTDFRGRQQHWDAEPKLPSGRRACRTSSCTQPSCGIEAMEYSRGCASPGIRTCSRSPASQRAAKRPRGSQLEVARSFAVAPGIQALARAEHHDRTPVLPSLERRGCRQCARAACASVRCRCPRPCRHRCARTAALRHDCAATRPAICRTRSIRVGAVAQRQYPEVKVGEAGAGDGGRAEHGGADERRSRIGRIALSIGADDEQRALRPLQGCGCKPGKRTHLCRHTGKLQRAGGLPRKLFSGSGLARMRHEQRCACVTGRQQGLRESPLRTR